MRALSRITSSGLLSSEQSLLSVNVLSDAVQWPSVLLDGSAQIVGGLIHGSFELMLITFDQRFKAR